MAAIENKNGGKGGGLIGLVVVTLVALGFGAGFGLFLASEPDADAKSEQAENESKAVKKQEATMSSTAMLVAMTPVVVNLAEPRDAWIRIEASLLVDGLAQGSDILAAQLAQDFVAYLRTASLSQFEGPSGFQNLREDLVDRAVIRDREHIKDVIIHGVVVE
ncbi:flagellar basal body-associated FliL family protein [Hyphomicrobium sp. CS1GBMeth3]|uniref:flagellar basal body-associated FliL family protein n=1 Tax=Hyphomicrobium sp. CS1GBMeth3 TaxID=1892845 RepID=UPI000931303A|nr:flagellar basal body-associated FliL family protein [Hyphomicrobium sp. CS1GBMeth3]